MHIWCNYIPYAWALCNLVPNIHLQTFCILEESMMCHASQTSALPSASCIIKAAQEKYIKAGIYNSIAVDMFDYLIIILLYIAY